LSWHDPVPFGEPSDAIVVDLDPIETQPSDTVEDLAPGPKQDEAQAPPPPPKQQEVEQKPEEKVDVPPAPVPAVAALPPPEEVAPPEPTAVPPASATTAPPRAHASKAQMKQWQTEIAMQFDRHKAYPRIARERRETGIALLDFTIDRQGRVVSSAIIKSSGSEALDSETLATLHRAQPFRAPPADADGVTFEFRLPVKFNIR
jgi:protein TonB